MLAGARHRVSAQHGELFVGHGLHLLCLRRADLCVGALPRLKPLCGAGSGRVFRARTGGKKAGFEKKALVAVWKEKGRPLSSTAKDESMKRLEPLRL